MPRFLIVLVLTVGVLATSGCGGDSAPITSANSKYEVADGNDATSAVGEKQQSPASPTAPPNGTPQAIQPGGITQGRPQGAVPQQPPATLPPAASGPASDSPQDLLAYVNELQMREPSGTNQQEVIENFVRTQDEIIDICERVFAMDVPPEARLTAAGAIVTSLSRMTQIGNPTASPRLEEFIAKLNASSDESLQKLGFQVAFRNKMTDMGTGKAVDPVGVIEDLNRFVAAEAKNMQLLQIGGQVASILEQAGHSEQAIEAFRLLAEAFKDVEDENLRENAADFTERAKLLESDITTMLTEMLEGDDAATAKFSTTAKGLLQSAGAGFVMLDFFQQVASTLEISKPEVARAIYETIGTSFTANPNEDLVRMAEQTVSNYQARSSLVGNPFTVEGTDLEGKKFDWATYNGKVVLVDFWSTESLVEMPNVRKAYDQYHAQGFEVVGVNLDSDMRSLQRFMTLEQPPWSSVFGIDPATRNPSPIVMKYGITSVPFLVLVGKDGKVLAANIRGEALGKLLAEQFPAGATSAAPGENKPAPGEVVPPGAAKSTAEPATPPSEPITPKSPEPNPQEGAASKALRRSRKQFQIEQAFVGSIAAIDSASPDSTPQEAVALDADDVVPSEAKEVGQKIVNPYAAPSGLSARQLVEFIFTMQEKPLSIQQRPGFAAAIADAADQVLEANASDQLQIVAAEAKFDVLHQAASLGDEQADRALDEFVHKMRDDERERITNQVKFFSLERKALNVDEIPLAALPELLKELEEYFASHTLTDKHLRIASATVHAINRIADGESREAYFKKFGDQFAASKANELARYGKKIGKAPARPVSELVGTSLELSGTTILGTTFDWEAYRGKIVIVDFWATWCGPCRRETPRLQALAKTSEKIAVVAVNLDRDLEAVEKYLEENQIEWTNLVGDEATEIASKYGIRAIPTMLVVNAAGEIVAVGNQVAEIQPKIQVLLAG